MKGSIFEPGVWRHVNVKKMTLDFEAKKALIIDFLFYEFLIQNWMD